MLNFNAYKRYISQCAESQKYKIDVHVLVNAVLYPESLFAFSAICVSSCSSECICPEGETCDGTQNECVKVGKCVVSINHKYTECREADLCFYCLAGLPILLLTFRCI